MYHDAGGDWIEEEAVPDRFSSAAANLAAEASAERFTSAGRTGVVLRFGWFYGPGARHAEQFFALARRGICISMGPPTSYVSSIHVADGGRAVAAALTAPAGIYNVSDDVPVTKRDELNSLAAALGAKQPRSVPNWLAKRVVGPAVALLTMSQRVSNSRFKEATGWTPRFPTVTDGWADAIEPQDG